MEHRCGHYSVTNCWNVGAMLGCRCDVSAFNLLRSMCRPSKIEGQCVDLRKSMCRPSNIDVSIFEDRRSMCRPSRIDDRCVDLRRWMIDVPTFDDRWSLCQPSKTYDRCEIMLLHLLKTLMVYLYANNCAEGLHFSAFIISVECLIAHISV